MDINDLISGVLGSPTPTGGGILSGLPSSSTDLGLALLANSGPSRLPTTFGQVLGQSAIQAQDAQSQAVARRANLAQALLGLQFQQGKLGAFQSALGGQGAPPLQGAPPMPQQPIGPPATSPAPIEASQPAPQVQAANTNSPLARWLNPPSTTDIAGQVVGPFQNPSAVPELALFSGQDPLKAAAEVHAQQLQALKERYAPQIQQLTSVVQSDNPIRDVKASPLLSALWQRYAPQHGLDPDLAGKDFTAANLRQVFGGAANEFRASLSEPGVAPPIPLQTRTDAYGRTVQTEPTTGKQNILPTTDLQAVLGPNGQPILVPKAQAVGLTPYSPFAATAAQMNGPVGALDAALSAAGVNIPGGRGGQLYMAKLANLIKANPGVSPQDIAQMVRTGQLDFNGAKRSTGQLATVAANANAQSRQLEKNLDAMAPLVQKMDSSGIPIVNKALAQLRQNWKANGDKDTSEFIGYMRATASEYAKIQSGGTGQAAPPEGEWKSAMDYMVNTFSTGGYAGVRAALMTEAANKRASYAEGLRDAAQPGATVGAGASVPAASVPTATGPGGKKLYLRNGKWVDQ